VNNKISEPLVSVIINCFNGAEYLNLAIDSVREQTYKNWEIIFWDNISTDNSAEIVHGYSDNRIKYFYADKHTPLYEARNRALRETKGEFVAFLDVDDIWMREKLSAQIPLFDDQSVGFTCTKYILLNQRRSNVIEREIFANQNLSEGKVTNELLSNYFVHMSTLIVRKKYLDLIPGPCDPRFTIIGDLDLVINLSKISNLAIVQRPLAYYRWHSDNTGLKNAYLFCDEFDVWFSEKDSDPEICNLDGYFELKKKNMWNKCIKAVFEGRKKDAVRLARNQKFGRKLKICISLLLPTKVTRRIIYG